MDLELRRKVWTRKVVTSHRDTSGVKPLREHPGHTMRMAEEEDPARRPADISLKIESILGRTGF